MKVTIRVGNIITHTADVIVNSADKSLMRGSGLNGAIHLAAGIGLQRECQEIKKFMKIDSLKVGEVISTKAYNLSHNNVIHTVGPQYGVDRISLLYDCYDKSLNEAEKLQAKSISFPAISTGDDGVPFDVSAKIVKSVLSQFSQPKYIKEITFFFVKQADADIYKEEFQ